MATTASQPPSLPPGCTPDAWTDARKISGIPSLPDPLVTRLRGAAAVLLEPMPTPAMHSSMIGPGISPASDPLLALGPNRAASLTLALSLPTLLPPLPSWLKPRAFWTQSVAVGFVTARLAPDDEADLFSAFAAGLLHDAGIPLLATTHAIHAEKSHILAKSAGLAFAAAWVAVEPDQATTPARAAADLAASWNLPAVAAALAPDSANPLAPRLRVARALVALRRMRAPADGADPPLLEADLKALDLTPATLADLFQDLAELTSRARRLLPHLRRAG
jgi:HD-like signal output (HDOD) protein